MALSPLQRRRLETLRAMHVELREVGEDPQLVRQRKGEVALDGHDVSAVISAILGRISLSTFAYAVGVAMGC
jgi:type II secretory pathway component PulM